MQLKKGGFSSGSRWNNAMMLSRSNPKSAIFQPPKTKLALELVQTSREENKETSCVYCDVVLNESNATADHIIPISDGGNNCQVNLVVCCKNCNNQRGNLDFREFMRLKKRNYKNLFI